MNEFNIYRDEYNLAKLIIEYYNIQIKLTIFESLELIKQLIEEIECICSSSFDSITFQQKQTLLSIQDTINNLLDQLEDE